MDIKKKCFQMQNNRILNMQKNKKILTIEIQILIAIKSLLALL